MNGTPAGLYRKVRRMSKRCSKCFGCIRMHGKSTALCAYVTAEDVPGVKSYYDEDFKKNFPIVSEYFKQNIRPDWCPKIGASFGKLSW